MPFCQNGETTICYEEVGSGYPLLLISGGGLRSCINNWKTAVFNAPEKFKNDFRCIMMDQRNGTFGQSWVRIPVEKPWDQLSGDQLGLMDHLGIRDFFVMGCCIGGTYVLNLIKNAPDRVTAGVMCQPIGHRPENPNVLWDSAHAAWKPDTLRTHPEYREEDCEQFLVNLYRSPADFVYAVDRDFVLRSQTPLLVMPDDVPSHPYAVAMEVYDLAPNAELCEYPWKDTPEKLSAAIAQVRSFLKQHQPVLVR